MSFINLGSLNSLSNLAMTTFLLVCLLLKIKLKGMTAEISIMKDPLNIYLRAIFDGDLMVS